MNDKDLNYLIRLVLEHTGIQLDASKSYLLESRLAPVLKAESLDSIEKLCRELRGLRSRLLLPLVIDAMTTNETSFFRDSLPFQHLAKEAIPKLIEARKATRKLRIWSAACSSGQEAVSLGIVLHESFPELATWDVKILGSDVSPAMVTRCEEATFSETEMGRGMPTDLRERYFTPVRGGWQAKSKIRDMISARQVNLIQYFRGIEQQDLILLRNVLIYFDEPTREKIFQSISRVLAPDGFLLLGTAEKPRSESYQRAFGPHANVFRKAG